MQKFIFLSLLLTLFFFACKDENPFATSDKFFQKNKDSAQISITGNLSFGDITVGNSSTKNVVIQNKGNFAVNITGIALPSGYTADWTSAMITAGESKTLKITFRPTQATNYQGDIKISYGNNQAYNLPVSGNGVAPNSNGDVVFWISSNPNCGYITVVISAVGTSQQITSYYSSGQPSCGSAGCANFTLPAGTYAFTASCSNKNWASNVTLTAGECAKMRLTF